MFYQYRPLLSISFILFAINKPTHASDFVDAQLVDSTEASSSSASAAAVETNVTTTPRPEDVYAQQRQDLKNVYLQNYMTTSNADSPQDDLNSRISKLQEINNAVTNIYNSLSFKNSQNVHSFDGVVSRYMGDLIQLGADFGFGNVTDTSSVIDRAKSYTGFPYYWTDKKGNSHECLKAVCNGFSIQHNELFVRAVSFAMDLMDNYKYEMGLSLISSVRDNYELNGGCYAGRVDRLFLAYLDMMNFLLDA